MSTFTAKGPLHANTTAPNTRKKSMPTHTHTHTTHLLHHVRHTACAVAPTCMGRARPSVTARAPAPCARPLLLPAPRRVTTHAACNTRLRGDHRGDAPCFARAARGPNPFSVSPSGLFVCLPPTTLTCLALQDVENRQEVPVVLYERTGNTGVAYNQLLQREGPRRARE